MQIVLTLLAAWLIQEYVQHFTHGVAAARWLSSWERYVVQYVIAFMLLYPAIRWLARRWRGAAPDPYSD